MIDLSVNIAGLSLDHPAMLGSGPIGVRGKDLLAFGQVAGALVTKSITHDPLAGSPQPRIVKIDHEGMLNHEGGPNPGIEQFSQTLSEIRSAVACPIIGSISPYGLRAGTGIERVTEKFIAAGASAIEIDFKYLYDEAAGRVDFDPRELSVIVRRIMGVAAIPVIPKICVGVINLVDLARAAEDGGAAAISAINTVFPAMKISLRSRRPVLSTKYGGLSGAPIRPIAIASVFRLHEVSRLPIIGVGGVTTAEDIVEFMLAGASAVQVYTAAQVRGPAVFRELREKLASLVESLSVQSVSALVGAGHEEDSAFDSMAAGI